MLKILHKRLRRLCLRLRWPLRRRSKAKVVVVVRKLGKSNSKAYPEPRKDVLYSNGSAAIHPKAELEVPKLENRIRIATFNAALFSMAPAVPSTIFDCGIEDVDNSLGSRLRAKSMSDHPPKGILKQSPLHPSSPYNLSKQQKFAKSKLRVSINLPDNEISLKRSGQLSFSEDEKEGSFGSGSSSYVSENLKGKGLLRSNTSAHSRGIDGHNYRRTRTILEVLRELDADILALQDVKAEEEKEMKPLSDLAAALNMKYVFAESWAPEYGNAVLSKWPIKTWKVQKIFDDTDFRNVLKVTIDVPEAGEVNFHCTHLDHLDEEWRMKQINAIIQSCDGPHILVGGINSLDESDYSAERWSDIVKYYEEMGKPTPKVEVMRFLKNKHYSDAKDFSGECEAVVMIAKGQSVQGTCKYGTRVDYILASPDSPYKFLPGSYSVFSSKGTSDHHIVKVDVVRIENDGGKHCVHGKRKEPKQRVVKIDSSSVSSTTKGIWKTNAFDR